MWLIWILIKVNKSIIMLRKICNKKNIHHIHPTWMSVKPFDINLYDLLEEFGHWFFPSPIIIQAKFLNEEIDNDIVKYEMIEINLIFLNNFNCVLASNQSHVNRQPCFRDLKRRWKMYIVYSGMNETCSTNYFPSTDFQSKKWHNMIHAFCKSHGARYYATSFRFENKKCNHKNEIWNHLL